MKPKPHAVNVRHKIKKNKTYRTLKVGDRIIKGDQFKYEGRWNAAKAMIGEKIIATFPPYRRLVSKRPTGDKIKRIEENAKNQIQRATNIEDLPPEWEELCGPNLSDKELERALKLCEESAPALDIQVDTGSPMADWAANPADKMVDDALNRISKELRAQRKPTTYEWYWTPKEFLVYAVLLMAILFGLGFCTRAMTSKPQIQYRDKIEYVRPMELQGIPGNPWRKAIPILPEDIKIENGYDSGETRRG